MFAYPSNVNDMYIFAKTFDLIAKITKQLSYGIVELGIANSIKNQMLTFINQEDNLPIAISQSLYELT